MHRNDSLHSMNCLKASWFHLPEFGEQEDELTRADRIGICLFIIGIAASYVTHALRNYYSYSTWDITNDTTTRMIEYSTPAAVVWGTRMVRVLIFGGVGLAFSGGWRHVTKSYQLFFIVFIACAWITSLRTYTISDFGTNGIFAPIGLVSLLASSILFISVRPVFWNWLSPFLVILSFVGSLAIPILAISQNIDSRLESMAWLRVHQKVVDVTALLAIGFLAKRGPFWRVARFLPLLVLPLAGLLMQTRSMLIASGIACVIYVFLRMRVGAISGRLFYPTILLTTFAIVGIIAFREQITVIFEDSIFSASWQEMRQRFFEDTRSEQARRFFEMTPISELIWGQGTPRPGEFNSLGGQGIDCGYVNIMFYGGIPLLVTFVLVHLVPAFRCLRLRLTSVDAAIVAVTIMYWMRFFSSYHPRLHIDYCVLMLLVGRCVYISQRTRSRIELRSIRNHIGGRSAHPTNVK